MIGPALSVVAVNACIWIAGAGLLRALGGWRTPRGLARRAGLAYMAGFAAVAVALQLALVLGIPFGTGLVLVVCALLAVSGLLARSTADAGAGEPLPRVLLAPAVVVLATIALLAVDLLFQPLGVWDAWAQWTAKAKAVVLFDGLDPSYLAAEPYRPWNPDYPVGLSAIEAASFSFMGELDTQVLHLQFWFVLAGSLLALAELLRGRVRPLLVWPTLLLVALAPSVQIISASALADVPVALLFALAGVCAWRWVEEGAGLWLCLVVVFASGAMATKVEGRIFALALFAALLVVVAREGRRRLLLVAGAAAVSVATLVPWLAWVAVHDVRGIFPTDLGTVLGADLVGNLDRLPNAVASLLGRSLDPRSWLLLVPLAAAAAVLAGRHASDRRGLGLAALTTALAYGGLLVVYWATPLDVEWHLRQSAWRVVAGPVLLLAALTPLLLQAALDGSSSRRVAVELRREGEGHYPLTP